jgi:hypothetical protein
MDERERWLGIQEIDARERRRCRCHLAPVEARYDRGALPISSIAEHGHCSRELRRLLWQPSESHPHRARDSVGRKPLNHANRGGSRGDILRGEASKQLTKKQRVPARCAVAGANELVLGLIAKLRANKLGD